MKRSALWLSLFLILFSVSLLTYRILRLEYPLVPLFRERRGGCPLTPQFDRMEKKPGSSLLCPSSTWGGPPWKRRFFPEK